MSKRSKHPLEVNLNLTPKLNLLVNLIITTTQPAL